MGTNNDAPTERTISDPPNVDTTMAQTEDETVKLPALLFQHVFAVMNDCSTLQLRESVIKKEFETRQAEFKSSEAQHEKYPNVAERQALALARAETAFKAVSEEVKLKRSDLDNLIPQAVGSCVQHILNSTANAKREESQSRVEDLQKSYDAKFQSIQSQLEGSQKQSEAQQGAMENLMKSLRDVQRQLEESQKQAEAQQQAIENLKKSQEEKYNSLEESTSQLSVQSGYTKTVLNDDYQPKVTSALARIAILESDAKTLSAALNATKELATGFQAELPLDLRARLEKLNSLQDSVAVLPKLRSDLDEIRQESERSNKGLVKHTKNMEQLEGFFETVNRLELIINGTRIPFSKGLSATVTELMSKAAGGAAGSQAIKQVEERLNTSLSNIKEDVATFHTRLRGVESRDPSATVTASLDSATQSRVSKLEESISSVSGRFATIDAELIQANEKLRLFEKSDGGQRGSNDLEDAGNRMLMQAKNSPATPQVDFEILKSELLEVVEEKQAAGDAVIMAHSARLEKDTGDMRDRLETVEKLCFERIATCTSHIERVDQSFELRFKQHLDEGIIKLLNSIRLNPDILPIAAIKSQILQAVMDQLESVTDALVVLEQRSKSINTKDMAMFILNQLEAAYPDIRNVQDMLRDVNMKLGHHREQCDGLLSLSNALKAQVDTLKTEASQRYSHENSFQSLRGEVDNLAVSIGRIQGAANEAKKQSEVTHAEDAKSLEQIASLLGILGVDMEETKKALQQVKAAPTADATDAAAANANAAAAKADGAVVAANAAAALADSATAAANAAAALASAAAAAATATTRPSSANITSATVPSRSSSASVNSSRPMAERSGPSQPLTQGDSGNKRRKLNGSHSSHGVGSSLKVPNGSRRRKRHKFGPGDFHGDDSEDSTFEPNQPTISDDGDES